MMSDKHPIQTEKPYRYDSDEEIIEAALEELTHFMWRADTSPERSSLDPNLQQCREHLEYLQEND